jgi:hypothetical protein
VALVLAVALLNIGVVLYSHGRAVGHTRAVLARLGVGLPHNEGGVWLLEYARASTPFVPPWTWSREEWSDVLPWRSSSPSHATTEGRCLETECVLLATADLVRTGAPGSPRASSFLRGHTFALAPGGASLLDGQPILDAWGHPILYRCPGPVHARGWDLCSFGPNGLDEHGGGDDILLGDDVAPVAASP